MRSVRLLCSVVVALSLLLGAQTRSALGAGGTSLSFEVETPGYSLTPDGIVVPGYAVNDVPGAPVLPVYGTVLEIPASSGWTISYETPDSYILPQRRSLRAVPVPQLPVEGPSSLQRANDLPASIPVIDRPDPGIYGSDRDYPLSPVVSGVAACQHGRLLLPVRVYPFQYNPGTQELLYHPRITVTVQFHPAGHAACAESPVSGNASWLPADNLDELGALLVRTGRAGMHRLTHADLQAAGVPLDTVDPASFTMTLAGQTIPLEVLGEDDGRFDPGDLVIFYAEAYAGRWSTTNAYRFAYGSGPVSPGSRMTSRATVTSGSEPVLSTVIQLLHVERDRDYYSNYMLPTETDHFFDSFLNPSGTSVVTTTYDLQLDDPVGAGVVQVSGLVYGGKEQAVNPDQSFDLRLNDHSLGLQQWDGRTGHAFAVVADAAFLQPTGNKLHLVASTAQLPPLADYYIYPDKFDIAYPALADVEADSLSVAGLATSNTQVQLHITGFSVPDVRAYDVRDPKAPVRLTSVAASLAGPAYAADVWDAWDPTMAAPRYEIVTSGALLAPASIEVDRSSSWKSPQNAYDYIAIVHRSLADAIQPLLDRRAAQGLRVAKVDVQDIYDEFGYGQPHQQAIRDFLGYAYHNWNGDEAPPRYVLLVGDGHYDFKNVLGTPVPNLILPFLINIDPWIGETASDNRYVSVDGPDDYLPEMSIGRITAWNPTDVANVISKIAAYEDESGVPDQPWQNRVVFVADDDQNSAGNFHALSDNVRLNWLPSYYDSAPIYYNPNNDPAGVGYTTAADMKSAIKRAFNDGALLLQWFGHASRFRWGTADNTWKVWDPPTLDPNTHLPFVISYSCWTGYFINLFGYMNGMPSGGSPQYQTLGEIHLLQAGRGAIADLSPSGQHVGSALSLLDQGLTKSIFQDRTAVLGAAVDAAKLYYFANATAWMDVLDTSVLFGDPALRLRLPLPPPVAPSVSAARGANAGVTLTWSHLEPDASYEIWRGTTPYFISDREGSQVAALDAAAGGYVVGGSVSFSDAGTEPPPPVLIVGDPVTNYFWTLRGANWRGSSEDSNRVGEFDFALTADSSR